MTAARRRPWGGPDPLRRLARTAPVTVTLVAAVLSGAPADAAPDAHGPAGVEDEISAEPAPDPDVTDEAVDDSFPDAVSSTPLSAPELPDGRGEADEYVVRVTDPAELVEVAQEVADGDAVVTDAWDGPLAGLTAVLTEDEAAVLATAEGVATVEENVVFEALGTQTNPGWNLDRIDQRPRQLDGRYSYPGDGAGVDVYVLDSGVRAAHVEFGGRVRAGHSVLDDDPVGTTDCNGHGTHVAGVVAGSTHGVAKAADVVPVKVLDCSGQGALSEILAGISWVVGDHRAGRPAVANLSLGGGSSESLDDAVRDMVADGITVVVAAGNDGKDACTSSPARVPAAITVGASTPSDSIASFSNNGSCVDIFAPGIDIAAARHTSNTGSVARSGTSTAAPHVAGAAALVLDQTRGASPSQVWSRIRAAGTTDVLAGECCGEPDRLLFVHSGATCRGFAATKVGGSGADTIRGTAGRDVIVAKGGNDTIRGFGGNDLICAGGGSDTVRGGSGADVVYGQSGSDSLLGGGADDLLIGASGPDDLVGGPGNDRIRGMGGQDLLLGGRGADRLLGGAHRDVCRGAGGFDRAAGCEVRRGVP